MMRAIISICIFLMTSLTGFTQVRINYIQGEIDRKDNTKIVCLVEHRISYSDWVRYRLGSTSPTDSVPLTQIKRLKTQYSEFENIEHLGTERLMHKQVRGKYNLYVYTRLDKPSFDESHPKKDTTYIDGKYTVNQKQLAGAYTYITKTVYLLQAQGEYTELTEENFKSVLKSKTADCNKAVKAVEDPSLQLFKVGSVIKQYNACR